MSTARLSESLFRALLAVLFLAPLPFGSNRPWAAGAFSLATSLLVALALLALASGRLSLPAGRQRRAYWWPLSLLLLVQGWIFLQTVPFPLQWVELISPRAAALHRAADTVTITLDAAMTRYQLMLGMTYTGLFFLTVVLVNSRQRVSVLLWTLTLAGALQALYGAAMTLTGLEYGFFVEKYVGQGVATGTFVNRNHFAGYMVMTLACGIGLLVSRLGEQPALTGKQRLRSWVELFLSAKFLLRILLAIMVIGLVLSRSRMGNLAFFSALTFAGGLVLMCSRHKLNRKLLWLFASLLLVDLLIVGRWFGAGEVAQRLVATTAASEQRDDVAAVALTIVRDYPWTGAGAGSFYTVFPHYSTFVPEDDYYTHAHNDYLELAADLGLPALALLAICVLATAVRAFSYIYHSDSGTKRGLGCTVIMTVTWAVLHATADFNLQIPANAGTFTTILALAWLDIHKKGNKSQDLQSQDN